MEHLLRVGYVSERSSAGSRSPSLEGWTWTGVQVWMSHDLCCACCPSACPPPQLSLAHSRCTSDSLKVGGELVVTLEGLSVSCLSFPPAQGEMHFLTSQGRVAWGCLGGAADLRNIPGQVVWSRPFILQVSTERERSLFTTSQEESQTLAVPSASAIQIPGSAQDSECPSAPTPQ